MPHCPKCNELLKEVDFREDIYRCDKCNMIFTKGYIKNYKTYSRNLANMFNPKRMVEGLIKYLKEHKND